MVGVDLGKFKEVGTVLSWKGQRCRVLIPVDTPPEKEKVLILRASIDAFLFGPNYVPKEMIYRSLGVASEMAFLTGATPASDNIITLPRAEVKQELEFD